MQKKFNIIFDECISIIKKIKTSHFNNKKILILGANAFLCTYLYSIFFLKNKNSNSNIKLTLISKSKPRDLIKYIVQKDKNINYIKANLLNETLLKKILKKKYDFIFYAATYGQPKKWMENQSETIDLNTSILKKFLHNYKNTKTKIMYFSSIDIYGNPDNSAKKFISENTSSKFLLNSRRITYGESKRMGEIICMNYIEKFKMNIRIVRPSHTYGPGMSLSDNKVIIDFIKKAKSGKLNLLDDGSAIKTFGYISDVTEMFLNIILREKEIYIILLENHMYLFINWQK